MALVPLVRPDLYELANNHHWRTAFSITNWAVPAPDWMRVGSGSGTEREWTLYGFQNYYALLDCGFRLRPAAGTANGVHPVPLGFSRVYVHLNGGFSYAEWLKALNEGRSFLLVAPHVALFPGLAVFATVLGINFLGDGLRDWLDVHTAATGYPLPATAKGPNESLPVAGSG